MATYFARKSGNINATDVWATTPSGTAAAVTFASGDVLMANSFAITVNVSTDLGGSGQVRNDTTGEATAGGNFTLSNGVTLTANVFSGNVGVQTIAFNAATGFLVGNITAGSPGGNWHSVNNSGSGTLTITGNVVAGKSASSHGVGNTSTGIITITGNVTGGSAATCIGARNNNTGTINITGTVTGGSNSTAIGAENSNTGTINITGSAIGGTAAAGASNTSTGSITATRATGNGFGPGSVGLTAATGIANSGLGVVTIEQLEYGTLGQSPTTGTGFRLKKVGTNVAVFNFCDTAGAKTLIDATANAAMPPASDVRSGVSYASGAATGSCAVPAAGSVALGVPVDNTVGTAVLDPADIATAVWGAATRTITGGSVDTLTNAPASVTPADIWGYNARTLTSASGPTASEISAAVWAAADKTGYSLTSAERSAIATAVESSLLNEADGQQVLNAIVGAIGNSNVDEIALVAAIRADLERNGGKLDSIPTTSAPSASTVAGAVRSELTTELSRIDQSISSRLASADYTAPTAAPTAAQNASAVRTELSVELARVDAAVSSRSTLTTGDIPSADITAIKTKTDALNSDRLANVATTQIVGTLLAQANS